MKRCFFYLFMMLCILIGYSCNDKMSKEEYEQLAESNYQQNNAIAQKRLKSIMFHNEDMNIERFKIVHISDTHVSARSSSNHFENPRNLKEAIAFANQDSININALVMTGDLIDNGKKEDALKYMSSFFTSFYSKNNIPSFYCYGNHDSNIIYNKINNTRNEEIGKSELHLSSKKRGNYDLERPYGENYFYADVDNPMGETIRIISLDMLDQEGTEYYTQDTVIYSEKQVKWFCEIALKEGMTSNHSVIVLNHYPFQKRCWDNHSTYLNWGGYVYPWNMIPEIVEAFREKISISKTYHNSQIKDSIVVNTDFSSCPGEFICYMGGHAHVTARFEIAKLENSSGNLLPQQMLLCTNMSPSEVSAVYNKVKRVPYSLSDNSFCIYAIDTKEKKIDITFFGAYLPEGMTNEEYPEIQVISY